MDIQTNNGLSSENILFEIAANTRDEALTLLVKQLDRTVDGFNLEAAVRALKERETVLPTVIAPGVALPHARLDDVNRPLIAIASTRKGIIFDAGKDPVNLILLVLTPKNDPSAYLRVLAMLSSSLKSVKIKEFVEKADEKEIVSLFLAGSKPQKEYLTALDIMISNPITLRESDTLRVAITMLCSRQLLDMVVVDEQGDLRGVIHMEDLLNQSLPQHLLWMEDLSPILHFEPFAEMLKKDNETKLADFMHEDYVSVGPDTPAVQLAKIFIMKNVRQIQVLEGRRLLGVVSLRDFATKLFWA